MTQMPLIPTTEPAKRIATLFRRRLVTPWSEREIRVYKKLVKAGHFRDPDELTMIERYYEAERKKTEGYHRRDLYTFLNNYPGELDRARAHKVRMNGAPKKFHQPELTEAQERDFDEAGKIAAQQLREFRERMAKGFPLPI